MPMKRSLPLQLSPLLLLTLLILGASLFQARAQESNRAGLVVQFGDGTLNTYCISFEGEGISGFDLLEASGLSVVSAFDPTGGAAVCKIGDEGCPEDNCFCQVDTYWSYWHLENGEWVYSQSGSSVYTAEPGDVDGWRWSQGDPPTVVPFEEICAPPATDTPTASTTPTMTNTSQPSATATETAPTSTPTHTPDTPYPGPENTETPYPGPEFTATPYPGPESTPTPLPASPTPAITDTPTPDAYPGPENTETSPTSTEPYPVDTLEATPEPDLTLTAVSADLPTPTPEETPSGTAGIEIALLVFGVLTISLGAGLLIVLYRQGQL